jgi:hypothetical protein
MPQSERLGCCCRSHSCQKRVQCVSLPPPLSRVIFWNILLKRSGIIFYVSKHKTPPPHQVVCYSDALAEDLSKAVNEVRLGVPPLPPLGKWGLGRSFFDACPHKLLEHFGHHLHLFSFIQDTRGGGSGSGCAIKTGKRNVSKKHSNKLNDVNAAWVQAYYKADLGLYRRYCSHP